MRAPLHQRRGLQHADQRVVAGDDDAADQAAEAAQPCRCAGRGLITMSRSSTSRSTISAELRPTHADDHDQQRPPRRDRVAVHGTIGVRQTSRSASGISGTNSLRSTTAGRSATRMVSRRVDAQQLHHMLGGEAKAVPAAVEQQHPHHRQRQRQLEDQRAALAGAARQRDRAVQLVDRR